MRSTTLCKHFKQFGGTRIFSASKGVCYSLNLVEYFPQELKESLEASSKDNAFQSDAMTERDIFLPGPMLSMELVINIEGNTNVTLPIYTFYNVKAISTFS